MARPVVLSNGEMHVGLNEFGLLHDLYFPYVGKENHTADKDLVHRIGVWVDAVFSWVDDGSWQTSVGYHPDTLIAQVVFKNPTLGVTLVSDDFVDASQSVFVRSIEVVNEHDDPRVLRIFFHQVFVISGRNSDTVQYVPDEHAMLHYSGHRSFVVSAQHAQQGSFFKDYSCGLYGIEGHLGTYKDAEDGQLSGNSVEHGKVDSVICLDVELTAHDSGRVQYWIAAGKSQREAFRIHNKLAQTGTGHALATTATHWHDWLSPVEDFADKLDDSQRTNLVRSLLTVKAHIDKRGAVIASTDTTMLNYARDAYGYSWPRDGAYAIWPLVRLGFVDEPVHFFGFCRRVLSDGGYLQHKYQADGSVGSSWHSYLHDGESAPPIQTDETASVLFVFQQYYAVHNDEKLLRDFYPTLVAPMANFLAGYVDSHGLPKPSYDLWEEKFLTSTYTTGVTYAALLAASELADVLQLADDALRWRTAADAMRTAAPRFFDAERGHLIKGYLEHNDGTVDTDTTLDCSSLYGAYMFGLFEHDSVEVTSTYQHIRDNLASSEGLGYPRYEGDNYNTVTDLPNPWPICSLWMAQYAVGRNDFEHATELLNFVTSHGLPSGILAEQLHPYTHESISVAPLTWSHAEVISTLIDLHASVTEGTS